MKYPYKIDLYYKFSREGAESKQYDIDWCVKNFGDFGCNSAWNWEDNQGYQAFQCRFLFANKEDLVLFKLACGDP